MLEFHKAKTYKKFIFSPVTFFLLLIILLILFKALWGVYQKKLTSAQYLERTTTEYQKLEERKKSLVQSVEYMKTEKGIEAEIRNKFRVVKDGELVAVIIDNDPKVDPIAATTTSQSGFWKKLRMWFVNMI